MNSVTDSEFPSAIEGDEFTLVDFWAEWCAPCKTLEPTLAHVEESRADVRVLKLDVDRNQATAKMYGVLALPTMIMFRKGREIARTSGSRPLGEMLKWVDQIRMNPSL